MQILILNGLIVAFNKSNTVQLNKQIFYLGVLATCWLTACNKTGSTPDPVVGPKGTAVDNLAKGINLSNWFNDYSDPAQYSNRFNNSHFKQIKDAGFTYVRLPIGPSVLSNPNKIEELQVNNLVHIENAVKGINAAGLGVIIEMHAFGDNFEARLAIDPLARLSFRQFWKNLATHFKGYDTSKVFFEVWNEPHIGADRLVSGIDKNWWAPFQEQVVNAIREATPNHYIIVTAENYSNWYELIQLPIIAKKNIIYNFHFYEPFTYTHQGADWIGPPYSLIRFLPYPGTPSNVSTLAANASNASARFQIEWYGRQQYAADSINKVMQQVYNWSVQKKVDVICNEFGVHKKVAPPETIITYLTDVHTYLHKFGIGWGVWDYDDTFGIATYTTGTRAVLPVWDKGSLKALQLN